MPFIFIPQPFTISLIPIYQFFVSLFYSFHPPFFTFHLHHFHPCILFRARVVTFIPAIPPPVALSSANEKQPPAVSSRVFNRSTCIETPTPPAVNFRRMQNEQKARRLNYWKPRIEQQRGMFCGWMSNRKSKGVAFALNSSSFSCGFQLIQSFDCWMFDWFKTVPVSVLALICFWSMRLEYEKGESKAFCQASGAIRSRSLDEEQKMAFASWAVFNGIFEVEESANKAKVFYDTLNIWSILYIMS